MWCFLRTLKIDQSVTHYDSLQVATLFVMSEEGLGPCVRARQGGESEIIRLASKWVNGKQTEKAMECNYRIMDSRFVRSSHRIHDGPRAGIERAVA
jgi:hypothetical protein